ncbi:MAG: diguanylate cyclase domain-containing protein [Micromonosporaceae bacterium]
MPQVNHSLIPGQTKPTRRVDARAQVLAHALEITSAATVDDLIARTLAGACALTGAAVAVAIDPTGRLHGHGDKGLSDRLAGLDPSARAELTRRPGGTRALAGLGLPSAVVGCVGDLTLIVADPTAGRLNSAAAMLALLTAHAQACLSRLRELDRLRQRANSDPLTGLRHHRPFAERLGLAAPGHTAVVAIDVDGFKKINDRYGHQAGDRVLVALVEGLRAALRDGDEFYRIGGDEFAVVVDVNGELEASAIAQRLLVAARKAGHTVSVGVAVNALGEAGRDTFRRADEALYQAKRAGRNTARLASRAAA